MTKLFLPHPSAFISVLCSILLSISCQIIEYEEHAYSPTLDSNEDFLSFTASFNDVKETKTEIHDGNSIWWSPKDSINVFCDGAVSAKLTSSDEASSSTATFSGPISPEIVKNTEFFWGVYPYDKNNKCDGNRVTLTLPSDQTGVEGSFASGLFPAIARTTTNHMKFQNVCGGIRFTVSKPGIQSVTIISKSGEALAGTVNVKIDEESNLPVIEKVVSASDRIVFRAPKDTGFEVDQQYFIVTLPGTFKKGFVYFLDEGTSILYRENTHEVSIGRSRFRSLTHIDYAKQAYSIGDIVALSGGLGIVSYHDSSNGTVWLMSVDELQKEDWDDSYSWCYSYGNSGWYMPGLSLWQNMAKNYNVINYVLEALGYNKLNLKNKYWTSDHGYIESVAVNPKTGEYDHYQKSEALYTRAVNSFKTWSVETLDATVSWEYDFLGSTNKYCATLSGQVNNWSGGEKCFYYSETPLWSGNYSSDGIRVAADDNFCAIIRNLKEDTQYYCIACVEKTGVYGYTRLGNQILFKTPKYYLPPYVDFGLPSGLKWGTVNVGAVHPTDVGGEYVWGVTGYHGTCDYQTGDVLKLGEDGAHLARGGCWRTPTKEEWEELFTYCQCSYTIGGPGMIVSRNGQQILLPLLYYWSATCSSPYWSSSSGGYLSATAYALIARSSDFETYISTKQLKTTWAITSPICIRAVYDERLQ